MHTSKHNAEQNQGHYTLYLVGAVVSFILSYWVLLYHQPINVDGILYLQTAGVFLQNGIHAAFHSYSWPYYSIGIALIHKITLVNLERSARLFNAILGALLTIAFTAVVKELGANRRTLIWALIIILIFPTLNHLRDNILRDFGYNAFSLFSLIYFIRLLKEHRWSQAIAWNLLIFIAILFRGEGLIILMAAPIFILFQTQFSLGKRALNIIRAYTLPLVILLLGICFVLFSHSINLTHVINSTETFNFLAHGISAIHANFNESKITLQQTLFSSGLYNSPGTFLIAGMIAMFVQTFLSTLNLFYFILVCFALYYHCIPQNPAARLAWSTYLILNLVIIFCFVATDLFLAQRYVLQLVLLIMLAIPFGIDFFYESWRNKTSTLAGNKWVFFIIVLGLIILAIDGLGHFGPSKSYILDAGKWIDHNTPPESLLYSNDAQVVYYSKRTGTIYPDDFLGTTDPLQKIKQVNLKKYDYVAILIPKNLEAETTGIYGVVGSIPIKAFQDKRKDSILIFKNAKN